MAEHSARPVDRAVGGYLAASAVALAFPHRPTGWSVLLLLHVGLAALLLGGALDRARRSLAAADPGPGQRAARGVVDLYPLVVLPIIYLEIQVLNSAVWGGRYFDEVVMGWEQALFGGQPSMTLAASWDSLLLSEALHLAYLSFFPILYLFPLALYLMGRREAFQRTLFAVVLGLGVHYLVFVFFPVQGPRYLHPGPAGAPTDGVLYHVTRTVLEGGSSQGAAFPSSHVALAAVQAGNAFRYAPAVAPVLVVATLGIALGAVYGGFHYAVDATVGLATGTGVALLAPAAWRALR